MLDTSDGSVPILPFWKHVDSYWHTFKSNFSDRWHELIDSITALLHIAYHSMLQFIDQGWLQIQQVSHHIVIAITTVTAPLVSEELWQIVLYWVLILIAFFGVIGAFVPALPGITLILGAIIVWGLVNGFVGLWWAFGIAIAALLLSFAIDYLAGIIGAQKVGASRWGQVGAIVGMFLGFFGLIPALPLGGPIFGILFGTVLGAFVGEFLHRRELKLWPRIKQSFRVGLAIVVGTLVGNLLQGLLATVAFVVFFLSSWSGV